MNFKKLKNSDIVPPKRRNGGGSGFFSAKVLKPSKLPRILAWWSYGILGLGIITMFLPWTQNIRSYGYTTTFKPGNRPQTIHSTIAGRVEEWHVYEGEFVEKGDTIVELSEVKGEYLDPRIVERLQEQIDAKLNSVEASKAKIEALGDQVAALRDALRLGLEKAENKIAQAQQKLETAKADYLAAKAAFRVATEQAERYAELFEKGLASEQEFENYRLKAQQAAQKLVSAENKLTVARQELAAARIELNATRAEYLDKIAKAESNLGTAVASLAEKESELLKLRTKVSNVQERKGFLNITAPQDARVMEAIVSGVGETVKEGEPVVSILPANPDVAVALFIDPIDMPLIDRGTPVQLQFEGWPAIFFSGWPATGYGTFEGQVAVIDQVATKEGKFRVLVIPEAGGKEWPEQINIGSGVLGWMILQDVPVWFEIWRQLNGFPPEYPGELKEGQTFDKKLEKLKKK